MIINNFLYLWRPINVVNMYTFKANIIVTQGRQASSKAEKALQAAAQAWIFPVLDLYHLDHKESFSYDHQEERYEMLGIDYVSLNIQVCRECQKLHSVVCLSQILQGATALYNGVNDTKLMFQLLENVDVFP